MSACSVPWALSPHILVQDALGRSQTIPPWEAASRGLARVSVGQRQEAGVAIHPLLVSPQLPNRLAFGTVGATLLSHSLRPSCSLAVGGAWRSVDFRFERNE